MAKALNLSWRDLSAAQVAALRGLSLAALPATLAHFLELPTPADDRTAILLDLYAHTIKLARDRNMSDEKASCLFSIVKETHQQATGQRLTVQRAFAAFKSLLLQHAVQRPPFSVGVFNYEEMSAITEWALEAYFRHYKLYMYAFTDRVTMSLSNGHPADAIELAPSVPPLADAITEAEHDAQVAEEERLRRIEEEKAAAEKAEAEAAAAEAARLKALDEQYEAMLPEEIKAAVGHTLAKEVTLLRGAMEEQFQASNAKLLAKLAELGG